MENRQSQLCDEDGFFSALKWGSLQDHYCRIGQQPDGLTLNCLPGGRNGTVEVDGAHIHMAWGTMMARMVLDGTLQSPTHFQGTIEAKLAGIGFADPELSSGSKQKIALETPDKSGKSALLRTILTEGLEQVPHDHDAIKKASNGSSIPALGAVEAIAYLGQQTKFGGPAGHEDQVDYFSVYAVEFESGERICGLHQRADGVLDAFLCL